MGDGVGAGDVGVDVIAVDVKGGGTSSEEVEG